MEQHSPTSLHFRYGHNGAQRLDISAHSSKEMGAMIRLTLKRAEAINNGFSSAFVPDERHVRQCRVWREHIVVEEQLEVATNNHTIRY